MPSIKQRDQKAAIFTNPSDSLNIAPLSADQRRRFVGKYGYLAEQFLREMPANELTIIAETQTMWADIRWAFRHEQAQHLDDVMLRHRFVVARGWRGTLSNH